MNTIVNITGITLKCLGASDENVIRKIKKDRKEYHKKYYIKNRIKRLEKCRQNRSQTRIYERERRKNNPNFRIAQNLRRRINIALKGINKNKPSFELLGCNLEQLWIHLEKSFKPGMNRKNQGLWHIDHIRPCVSFDLTKPEEQAKCFHYTNLQALWAHENISKGAKITTID